MSEPPTLVVSVPRADRPLLVVLMVLPRLLGVVPVLVVLPVDEKAAAVACLAGLLVRGVLAMARPCGYSVVLA